MTGIKEPASVTLLRTGETIPTHFEAGTLTVTLAPKRRTDSLDVVKVQWT